MVVAAHERPTWCQHLKICLEHLRRDREAASSANHLQRSVFPPRSNPSFMPFLASAIREKHAYISNSSSRHRHAAAGDASGQSGPAV